ncbi:hypothetical protein C8J57DRAFT_1241338 [Mycena rebaudengoi]|nr:hypothetical protein C8J57DRAFT_1241338 [Mycena rebaudengoi]
MSAFNILDCFQHKGAHRVPTQNRNSAYAIWHVHYSTRIRCTDLYATAIAAEFHVSSSGSSETLAEGAVDHLANEFVSFVSAVGTQSPHKLQDPSMAIHESASSGSLAPSAEPDAQVPGDSAPLAISIPASSELPPSAPDTNILPQRRFPQRRRIQTKF